MKEVSELFLLSEILLLQMARVTRRTGRDRRHERHDAEIVRPGQR